MKTNDQQLRRQLQAKLESVYLVAGDEPLLVDEALSDIREAAKRAGFDDRELHVVDRHFQWAGLEEGSKNLSLFATRQLIELRLASPKPGDEGARTLRRLVADPSPDQILLVGVWGKLDAATAKSVWVKAIESAGVVVDIRSVEPANLPRWVSERAKRYQLKLTRDAVEALAERVEGNLLAADQELRKLSLTASGKEIDAPAVLEAVANSARFGLFLLTDAVVAGDAPRAIRVLAGLQAEGMEPVLVLWALSRELSLMAKLEYSLSAGESLETAFARSGVWRSRQGPLRQALRRYRGNQLSRLLEQALDVDRLVKGGVGLRPWDALARLVVAMLGGASARPAA